MRANPVGSIGDTKITYAVSHLRGHRVLRAVARLAVVSVAGLAGLALAGCGGGDGDGDGDEDDSASRYCGIVDRGVVEPVLGDLKLTTYDADRLDQRSRTYNGVDCRLSAAGGSSPLLTIVTWDYADDDDRADMESRLRGEGESGGACRVLSHGRIGKACQDVDGSGETNIGIAYDDRWVRVIARTRDGDVPPEVDDVVAVADDVDTFLTADDAKH